MNQKVSKLLRRYCKVRRLSYNPAKNLYQKSTRTEQLIYVEEMKSTLGALSLGLITQEQLEAPLQEAMDSVKL